MCPQTYTITRTLLSNDIVGHSDVIRASPIGAAPTTSSFSTSPGFYGLRKDIGKTRREKFKFWELGCFILDI